MDIEEHKELREFDVKIAQTKLKQKLSFEQEMHKLRLEYLNAKDNVGDKRHAQRIQLIEKEFEIFLKRIEVKSGSL